MEKSLFLEYVSAVYTQCHTHLCIQILITEKVHKDTAREDLKKTTRESLEMFKKRNMVCQIYIFSCKPWFPRYILFVIVF